MLIGLRLGVAWPVAWQNRLQATRRRLFGARRGNALRGFDGTRLTIAANGSDRIDRNNRISVRDGSVLQVVGFASRWLRIGQLPIFRWHARRAPPQTLPETATPQEERLESFPRTYFAALQPIGFEHFPRFPFAIAIILHKFESRKCSLTCLRMRTRHFHWALNRA